MKDSERLAQAQRRIKNAGITQSAIAKRLEVPESTVSKVLNGGSPGKRGNAHKVAVALGIIDGAIGKTVDDVLIGLGKAA